MKKRENTNPIHEGLRPKNVSKTLPPSTIICSELGFQLINFGDAQTFRPQQAAFDLKFSGMIMFVLGVELRLWSRG